MNFMAVTPVVVVGAMARALTTRRGRRRAIDTAREIFSDFNKPLK
jgi:hypothetical protein